MGLCLACYMLCCLVGGFTLNACHGMSRAGCRIYDKQQIVCALRDGYCAEQTLLPAMGQ